jgi:hypothetical protein
MSYVPKTITGKALVLIPVVLVTVGVVFGFTTCWAWGNPRWSVKTGTDVDAGLVDLEHPVKSDVLTLGRLKPPDPIPHKHRVRPVETTVYVVSATLVQFKREPDGDYHLVLEGDDGSTMIAEIPNPRCVGRSCPFRDRIIDARRAFDARFQVTTSWQHPNVPVVVTGIGFFDLPHGQIRPAPNYIELHPVLGIEFP